MIRVRHYTRISAMRKILDDQRIVAADQNCVFVEPASRRRLAPNDAVEWYGIDRGCGNACVEFDIEDELLRSGRNDAFNVTEWWIEGDVDLTDRRPKGFRNA